eukprot:676975-Rhodomonas_salina.7
MEVAREPRLDAAVLAHQLDELAALLLVRVVEPAAAIDDVVLLQHAQARAVGGGVREDEDLPALGRGVLLQDLLEPQHLLCGCLRVREHQTFNKVCTREGTDAPSSMVTSCEVYLALLNTVEPRPTSSVFSAIWRLNCGVSLPCSLPQASMLRQAQILTTHSGTTKLRGQRVNCTAPTLT